MAWQIRFDRGAQKELESLDRMTIERILRYLNERIRNADNPRRLGEALAGSLAGLWKYRVGNHRLIVRIDDGAQTIHIFKVGNRREIYRR